MNRDDIDSVSNILSKGMRTLRLPVFTWWHTVILSVKAFLKNYVAIYFFAPNLSWVKHQCYYSKNNGADDDRNVDELVWPNKSIDLKGHDV